MTLSCVLSIGAWSSGVLSLIAPRQRHVGVSRWRSTASLDVSYLATPEAYRRSVLLSRRPSTLFSWEPQLSRWCGFRGKGRLNLPGHCSTSFARPLRCSLLPCSYLLRCDEFCQDRRQIDLSLPISSGVNKFTKRLAFVLLLISLIEGFRPS